MHRNSTKEAIQVHRRAGLIIRAKRKEMEMSMAMLARLTGLTLKRIFRIELGHSRNSAYLFYFYKISKVLNLKLSKLVPKPDKNKPRPRYRKEQLRAQAARKRQPITPRQPGRASIYRAFRPEVLKMKDEEGLTFREISNRLDIDFRRVWEIYYCKPTGGKGKMY